MNYLVRAHTDAHTGKRRLINFRMYCNRLPQQNFVGNRIEMTCANVSGNATMYSLNVLSVYLSDFHLLLSISFSPNDFTYEMCTTGMGCTNNLSNDSCDID